MYKENQCLISFCVPCYKVPIDKVKRCLESIYNCGMYPFNYEIIIVDDGDTKEKFTELLDTISVFKKDHDLKNVKIVSHTKNMSLFEARKSAVHVATGAYVCHVDSDDYLEPNCLRNFTKFYWENEDKWDIIQYNYRVVGDKRNKGLNKKDYKDEYISDKSLLKLFTVDNGIPGFIWGKLIARRVYKAAYSRMPDTYVNMSEDYLAMIFITTYSRSYKAFKDTYFYNYIRTEDSMTSHIKKITLDKWKNLLTVKNVIEYTDPKYFKDDDVKKSIERYHLKMLFELWSTLTLDNMFDSEENKNEAIKMFIDVFGEKVANELNETIKIKQKKYKNNDD